MCALLNEIDPQFTNNSRNVQKIKKSENLKAVQSVQTFKVQKDKTQKNIKMTEDNINIVPQLDPNIVNKFIENQKNCSVSKTSVDSAREIKKKIPQTNKKRSESLSSEKKNSSFLNKYFRTISDTISNRKHETSNGNSTWYSENEETKTEKKKEIEETRTRPPENFDAQNIMFRRKNSYILATRPNFAIDVDFEPQIEETKNKSTINEEIKNNVEELLKKCHRRVKLTEETREKLSLQINDTLLEKFKELKNAPKKKEETEERECYTQKKNEEIQEVEFNVPKKKEEIQEVKCNTPNEKEETEEVEFIQLVYNEDDGKLRKYAEEEFTNMETKYMITFNEKIEEIEVNGSRLDLSEDKNAVKNLCDKIQEQLNDVIKSIEEDEEISASPETASKNVFEFWQRKSQIENETLNITNERRTNQLFSSWNPNCTKIEEKPGFKRMYSSTYRRRSQFNEDSKQEKKESSPPISSNANREYKNPKRRFSFRDSIFGPKKEENKNDVRRNSYLSKRQSSVGLETPQKLSLPETPGRKIQSEDNICKKQDNKIEGRRNSFLFKRQSSVGLPTPQTKQKLPEKPGEKIKSEDNILEKVHTKKEDNKTEAKRNSLIYKRQSSLGLSTPQKLSLPETPAIKIQSEDKVLDNKKEDKKTEAKLHKRQSSVGLPTPQKPNLPEIPGRKIQSEDNRRNSFLYKRKFSLGVSTPQKICLPETPGRKIQSEDNICKKVDNKNGVNKSEGKRNSIATCTSHKSNFPEITDRKTSDKIDDKDKKNIKDIQDIQGRKISKIINESSNVSEREIKKEDKVIKNAGNKEEGKIPNNTLEQYDVLKIQIFENVNHQNTEDKIGKIQGNTIKSNNSFQNINVLEVEIERKPEAEINETKKNEENTLPESLQTQKPKDLLEPNRKSFLNMRRTSYESNTSENEDHTRKSRLYNGSFRCTSKPDKKDLQKDLQTEDIPKTELQNEDIAKRELKNEDIPKEELENEDRKLQNVATLKRELQNEVIPKENEDIPKQDLRNEDIPKQQDLQNEIPKEEPLQRQETPRLSRLYSDKFKYKNKDDNNNNFEVEKQESEILQLESDNEDEIVEIYNHFHFDNYETKKYNKIRVEEHIKEQENPQNSAEKELKSCTVYDEQNNPAIRLSCYDILLDVNEIIQDEQIINQSEKQYRESIEYIKNNSQLACLIAELKCTEQSYVNNSLRRLVEDYMPEMKKTHTPANLVGKTRLIFGNADILYEYHKLKFLPALEAAKSVNDIAECFLKYEEKIFQYYPLYTKNKPKSQLIMRDYAEFFKRKQDQLNDPLDLSSYLLTPIQRMAKYCQLIKSMEKECVKEGKPSEKLNKVSAMLTKLMSKGNDSIALESIRFYDGDLRQEGDLLLRDSFYIQPPQKKQSYEGMLFLFQESILITQIKRYKAQEYFEYQDSIKLCDMGYTDNQAEPLVFQIWYRKRDQKHYIIRTNKKEQQQKWVKEIFNLLWKQLEANKNRKKKEYEESGLHEGTLLVPRPISEPNNKNTLRSTMKKGTTSETIWYSRYFKNFFDSSDG